MTRVLAVILGLCAAPASAWTFSAFPLCTLSQPTEKGSVTVVYDPGTALYAISLTLTAGTWDPTVTFGISFLGNRPIEIGTTRHVLSPDGTTLTVTDTGFDNVLDGLQFNAVAQAKAGQTSMVMSLADAAEPVAAFRNCTAQVVS